MASKVTAEDILEFNRKYYVCQNYSQVARETGFSAATVRKYVSKDWKPADESKKKIFNPQDLPEELGAFMFRNVDDYGSLCALSEEEEDEIKELWEELEV